MNEATLYPANEALSPKERFAFNSYIITAIVLFLGMMALGLTMRMAQAQWDGVGQLLFYRFLTMHGTFMVGATAMVSLAVMWYFLRKYVTLHLWAFLTNYITFTIGGILIIASIFVGGYAGMWTFLYPLPVHAEGVWGTGAAATFFIGYLFIGVGFLLFFLDASAGIIKKYGNFGRAMGLQWLFGGKVDPDHPVAVIASTMVIISDVLGITAGAVILVMELINAFDPAIVLDALFAKELTYWFGHMFINATIFMAAIGIFELLPRYTGRPLKMNRIFVWAWAVSCIAVIVVVPHHLLMDFAQPKWAEITGQIASYVEGIPVFLETLFFVFVNVYRSGIRWKMPSRLIVLSVFGWSAGIVPAMLDGTIDINRIMHNTQWVPGHFHFYLILGVLPMVLATMYHVIGRHARAPSEKRGDGWSILVYLVGGVTFTLAFLAAGAHSVPRRYAEHIAAWLPFDKVGSVGAMLIIAGMLFFGVRIVAGLLKKDPRSAVVGGGATAGGLLKKDPGHAVAADGAR